MRIDPNERVVMIYGGCYNGNSGRMWRVRTGGQSVVSAQQTAQVAQALHAGTLQQRLTSGGEMREVVDDKPQKRGWFSRLFFGEDS